MEMTEVYNNLCMYDERNPAFEYLGFAEDKACGEDVQKPRTNCSCDNCFYGRDKLAMRIIHLEDYIDHLEDEVEGWEADNYDRQIGG